MKILSRHQTVIIILVAFIVATMFFIVDSSPPKDFIVTLVKPLEDIELYLAAFNQTFAGANISKFLSTVFGYYQADAIVFLVSFFTLGVVSLLFLNW